MSGFKQIQHCSTQNTFDQVLGGVMLTVSTLEVNHSGHNINVMGIIQVVTGITTYFAVEGSIFGLGPWDYSANIYDFKF